MWFWEEISNVEGNSESVSVWLPVSKVRWKMRWMCCNHGDAQVIDGTFLPKTTHHSFKSIVGPFIWVFLFLFQRLSVVMSLKVKVLIGCLDFGLRLLGMSLFLLKPSIILLPMTCCYFTSPLRPVIPRCCCFVLFCFFSFGLCLIDFHRWKEFGHIIIDPCCHQHQEIVGLIVVFNLIIFRLFFKIKATLSSTECKVWDFNRLKVSIIFLYNNYILCTATLQP